MLWLKIKKDQNTTKVKQPSHLFRLSSLSAINKNSNQESAHNISVHINYIVQTTDHKHTYAH